MSNVSAVGALDRFVPAPRFDFLPRDLKLAATNVAAHGLDIADSPAAFSSDMSPSGKGYMHRIGRAGASDLALTLLTSSEAAPVAGTAPNIRPRRKLASLPGGNG